MGHAASDRQCLLKRAYGCAPVVGANATSPADTKHALDVVAEVYVTERESAKASLPVARSRPTTAMSNVLAGHDGSAASSSAQTLAARLALPVL
ncbi:MAG: hypothetical protein H6707_01665 [Deltaproteobacteria bacterium]|nr:hypothetical protein [Deltaproteobacteria bacterium]